MSTTTLADEEMRDKYAPEELANPEITTNIQVPESSDKPGLRGYLPTVLFTIVVVGLIVAILTLPGRELRAGAALALMLVLMFMKVPVALSLALPGLLGIFAVSGPRALANVAGGIPFSSVASWSLSVLPMFVLMGLLLWSSGLTSKMYVAGRHWLGFLPGGLAVGTNTAGTALASVSGSTLGTTYALTRVAIPEMLRAGYDKKYAVASVISASLPGQLIPPSIFLVIVAGLIGVPVGQQLIAGVVPGVAVAGLSALLLMAIAVLIPKWVGRGTKEANAINENVTWADRFRSLLWVLPVAIIVVVVFGGIFSGAFTATEAGAVGAILAVVVCIAMQWKNKPIRQLISGTASAVSAMGMVFLMVIGAHVLSQLLAVSGFSRLLSSLVGDLGLGRVEFLFLIALIYVILGMFMDPLAILLLTIPIFLPIIEVLDVSFLWYGVFAVFMAELAVLTPPVGVLSFVVHSIVQDPQVNLGQKIALSDVFKAVGIMLPLMIGFIVLLILFPDIVTWLPTQMG